ncbi:hypothetical protein ACF0H5_021088 [Mactra antiquata]
MSLQAEVNTIPSWHPAFSTSWRLTHELHYDANCCYEPLDSFIIGEQGQVYIMVRKCVCGHYNNKYVNKPKRVFYVADFNDGTEIHIKSECRYIPKRLPSGEIRLEKICVCPRQYLPNRY